MSGGYKDLLGLVIIAFPLDLRSIKIDLIKSKGLLICSITSVKITISNDPD